MPDIKIVFMGTPDFSLPPLMALINNDNFDIQSVITQEDKKIGRKQVLTPPPVKILAEEYNIPILQPPSLKRNTELLDLLKGLKLDFIIVVAYGKLLPPEILEIPKFGCINIHGSLLPKYRGASPVEEAILNGNSETGITFIKMEEKLDAGPILMTQRIKIDPSDTSITLRDKLSGASALLLPDLLRDIYNESISPIAQKEENASYCHKIVKDDGEVDLEKNTATQIKNKLRAYTKWPGCYLNLNGKKLKLIEINIDTDSAEAKSTKAKHLIELENNTIGIGTKEGLIIPQKVQMEGKKEMSIQDFLRGNRTLLTELLQSAK